MRAMIAPLRRLVFIVMLTAATGGSGAVPDPEPVPDPDLAALLGARLILMQDVAAHKWQHGRAIEDAARERQVLDAAVDDALRYGFTPASSRALFAAQIEAAKAVQRYWFERWEGGGHPPPAPDLETVTRPELLRLGERILAEAAEHPVPGRGAFAAALDIAGLDAAAREALYTAAAGLERYPDRLRQVLGTGVLRVGTTADYPPFSYRGPDAAVPAGIDVDLARALGAALGVEVRFVPTTWAGLLDDLVAGRFDIAVGGVSRTLERQQRGFLTRPYQSGGKTPIARCEAAPSLGSLAAIDRREVRVAVNPGGTNERFVDAHLQRAQKVVHDDNRTIFTLLLDGTADVMITDRVEVELQTRRHPELCATMAEDLTYQEKAYLVPQDSVWLAFVDTWLDLALADGTVARTFVAHEVTLQPPR